VKTQPAPAKLDAVELANRLRPVLLHVNRHLRREVHALGVSPGQVSILSAVSDKPGIGVADLAGREGTSVPSMSVHIDRLEKAGLMERRGHEVDRRRVGLTVTPAGKRVLNAVRSRRTAWLATRLQTLSPDQLEAVDAAIGPLSALVER
jgi:DNA-binding MarR family transcriptional regulator